MTTIITRSAAVFHGMPIADDVASIVYEYDQAEPQFVTWADVMADRRERQAARLDRKRNAGVVRWRAVRLWVAYYDQWLMGGWQAFVDDYRNRCAWIDRNRKYLKETLMSLFPLVLPIGDQWSQWKIEFANRYRRRRHHRKPLGVQMLWHDGHHGFRLPT